MRKLRIGILLFFIVLLAVLPSISGDIPKSAAQPLQDSIASDTLEKSAVVLANELSVNISVLPAIS